MLRTHLPPPTTDDGRNLDKETSIASGEAAHVEVKTPEKAWPIAHDAQPAPATVPSETYYDLPAVKAAPWKWYVPAYFYVGGLSGAAATVAAAVGIRGDRRLGRRLHLLATIGHTASAGLLIADLGRPSRFYNMLRVFRPTSPMNVGTWILSAAGASSALALVRSNKLFELSSAVTGAMLSTYTGVLIGNTAIPIWKATRRELPAWFAAASAASLASALELAGEERRVYSIVAKAADLVGQTVVERGADVKRVGQPLRDSKLWRASKWLGVASLGASLIPGRSRGRTVIAGALGTASALCARFAIIEAGRASAADPRATFEPQRASAADPRATFEPQRASAADPRATLEAQRASAADPRGTLEAQRASAADSRATHEPPHADGELPARQR